MPHRRHVLAGAAALALPALRPARAQAWPNRPLRLIATFEPGGAADQLARAIAAGMGPELGQTVVVENRTGAAGNIGTELVARANDGHTFLLCSTGPMTYHTILFRSLPFDPQRDFTPIGFAAWSPNIFATRNDLGWKRLDEVVAAAKAAPGKLNFGSAGTGTTQHLAGEMLQEAAGIRLTHVPYRGGAPALRDLLGGQLELLVTTGSGANMMREGKITPIAVMGEKRIAALPDTPTMQEAGLRDFSATAWYGVVGPAGLPAPAVARMSAALRAALTDETLIARMRDQTMDAQFSTPDDFASFIAGERRKWRPVAQQFAGTM
ncbi:Bug family tripartite tricarboxylate transporter substrate binding protein [Pararoseomonas indoligenes]|uniref:Tripartite tricarboxylate transporter substrate binding protein n=1 Tax=Roseomonas indoligenes TaxID=2820811 RepID=A0A940S9L3_9PROT|nr:tripartite tricarboxylate transporter substrate binding protein [Pararoseomonas indoligenes]MBP0495403.1 tripartite tricarboxylate transporter substrate binding protein [Pararoseomonas indoligenes]